MTNPWKLRPFNGMLSIILRSTTVPTVASSVFKSIRTSIAHGKVKRQGRYAGRRSDWKKAYVKLAEGAKMPEFLEGA